ncbi:DUF885 family protein [Mycoplasma sp. 1781]
MTPKNKKALIISGIVGGIVLVPTVVTIIPYGAQISWFKRETQKNQRYEKEYVEAKKAAVEDEANKALKAKIDAKDAQIADLTQKSQNADEATKAKLEQEIRNAEAERAQLDDQYQENIESKILPILAKIAEEGDLRYYEGTLKNTAEYVVLSYKKFQRDLAKLASRDDLDINYPSKENAQEIIKFYQDWINTFSKINSRNLNTASTAWVSGLKYEWEIAKTVYASESRLLGVWLEWGLSSAYPINAFYDTISSIDEERAPKVQKNLKEGIESDVVLSKVVIKNNVRSILSNFYQDQLKEFLKGSDEEIKVTDLIAKNEELAKSSPKLVEFHKFYADEYYKASKSGLGENLGELKLYKTNKINEKENHVEVFDGNDVKTVYGVGLTEKDLNAKNVGLNSIVGKPGVTDGDKVYSGILKFSTTTDDTAQDVFNSGYETTTTAAKNMKLTAAAVAKLITGKDKGVWAPTIKYDADGLGPNPVKEVKLNIRDANGEINISDFYKWLNQEQFFFGREDASYYTEAKKHDLANDPKLEDARKNLTRLGYDFLKTNHKKYGSITNEQFYYGALEAFKGYHEFRDTTIDHGYSYFPKSVPRYGITSYEYKRRAEEGVGAYNGNAQVEKDGFGAFTFNVDPYYSLPKWSVTSFANHESVMGHHNQIYYAKKFLKTIDGLTVGNIFDYTSYAEGWALFMEWFGIESGLYGTPDFDSEDYYAFPVSFKHSNGITSFVSSAISQDESAVTAAEIKGMKELHGGVYWSLVASEGKNNSSDEEHTLRAVELANMLQYFGALNEAQLRNMRRAVDPAYHGRIEGKEDLPAGASIQDVRNFLHANSALGIGDITSESKRYLNLPGQATSYNAGKEAMLKLYDRVRQSKGLSRKDFVTVEDKANIKELLNLMLETGGLPLETLKEIVELHYKL